MWIHAEIDLVFEPREKMEYATTKVHEFRLMFVPLQVKRKFIRPIATHLGPTGYKSVTVLPHRCIPMFKLATHCPHCFVKS
jgi:hypothetical protein